MDFSIFGGTLGEPAELGAPAGVRELAESLLAEHGLTGWTVQFGSAPRQSGYCDRNKRNIRLSGPLMSLWTTEQIRKTVLHEIAHALSNGHHGPSWVAACYRIGIKPERCWHEADGNKAIPPKYTGTCPNGHTITAMRRNRLSCKDCTPRFNERYLFTWTENTK